MYQDTEAVLLAKHKVLLEFAAGALITATSVSTAFSKASFATTVAGREPPRLIVVVSSKSQRASQVKKKKKESESIKILQVEIMK